MIEKKWKEIVPDVILYEDFVSEEEEKEILNFLYDPRSKTPWVEVHFRRLKCFGGDPIKGATRMELPPILDVFSKRLKEEEILSFRPNHVLINEYPKKKGIIMPHKDGPTYRNQVACLSLINNGDFYFNDEEGKQVVSIQLPPRSLIVFRNKPYEEWLHGIKNVNEGTRVSLTFREILI